MKTNALSIDSLLTELVKNAGEAHANKVGAAKDKLRRCDAKVEQAQDKLAELEGRAERFREALSKHAKEGRGFLDFIGFGDYDRKHAELQGSLRQTSAQIQGESVSMEEARFQMESELDQMQESLEALDAELQNVKSIQDSNEALLDRLGRGVQGN
ncbi:MAG: hypothetical protein HYV07_12440 [Deltaproteobacteria bacterium]|nr:hypothetical protein [Deltaproteobacteria bacterium]